MREELLNYWQQKLSNKIFISSHYSLNLYVELINLKHKKLNFRVKYISLIYNKMILYILEYSIKIKSLDELISLSILASGLDPLTVV